MPLFNMLTADMLHTTATARTQYSKQEMVAILQHMQINDPSSLKREVHFQVLSDSAQDALVQRAEARMRKEAAAKRHKATMEQHKAIKDQHGAAIEHHYTFEHANAQQQPKVLPKIQDAPTTKRQKVETRSIVKHADGTFEARLEVTYQETVIVKDEPVESQSNQSYKEYKAAQVQPFATHSRVKQADGSFVTCTTGNFQETVIISDEPNEAHSALTYKNYKTANEKVDKWLIEKAGLIKHRITPHSKYGGVKVKDLVPTAEAIVASHIEIPAEIVRYALAAIHGRQDAFWRGGPQSDDGHKYYLDQLRAAHIILEQARTIQSHLGLVLQNKSKAEVVGVLDVMPGQLDPRGVCKLAEIPPCTPPRLPPTSQEDQANNVEALLESVPMQSPPREAYKVAEIPPSPRPPLLYTSREKSKTKFIQCDAETQTLTPELKLHVRDIVRFYGSLQAFLGGCDFGHVWL